MSATRPPVALLAIPGCSTTYLEASAEAIARAIEGVSKLSRHLGRRDVWSCSKADPIDVRWDSFTSRLHMTIDDAEAWIAPRTVSAFPPASRRSVEWGWGVLRWVEDAPRDIGWHPSQAYFALSTGWRRQIDEALGRPS